MDKVRYHEMLPHEIVRRRETFPAAFVGLGGLEWHSEHLAVGNDALKAEKFCELAARKSGGFLFPTLWYGEPRISGLMEAQHDYDNRIKKNMKLSTGKFTEEFWNVSRQEQEESYKILIYHVLLELYSLEMKAIILLCGHYPLYDWVAPSVEKFNEQFTDAKAFAGAEHHFVPNNPSVGGDHAGKWETSYLMYLQPECVDMSVYLGEEDKDLIGIMGEDPRYSASKEIGRTASNLIVDRMIMKSKELLDELS